MKETKPTQADLFSAAKDAREKAYCPYSRFKVGAAVRLSDGSIVSGANIENASFGACLCAERVAIFKAISEKGASPNLIQEILVITDLPKGAFPCGLCRQVLVEFMSPTAAIYIANLNGVQTQIRLSELLPHAFLPQDVLGT